MEKARAEKANNDKAQGLENAGKTILPLCTHEGSGLGSTEKEIATACPQATVSTGLAVRGGSAADAQSDFVLFVVHHFLNRSWSRNVLRGQYSAFRIVQMVLVKIMAEKFIPIKNRVKMVIGYLPVLISGYGVFAFFKRGIPKYLTLKIQFAFFDFDEPMVFFFADYIAVMILFVWIGYLIGNKACSSV
jgi:hypothetical protein